MKNILSLSIFFILLSCSTVKEGFQNDKKNNSDEFLVEKKSPLVMPPEFDKLPEPKTNYENQESAKSSVKELIQNKDSSNNNSSTSENLEGSLLEKIKKN